MPILGQENCSLYMPKTNIDIYYVRATGILSEIAISKLRHMLSVKHVITVSNP